jgi:hypothetical protein
MSTHSIDGRPWAKLSKLKPGDKIVSDGGCECIATSLTLEVKAENGELYVDCDMGRHFLDVQVSDEDTDSLVGFWRQP